jgi:hypothetical protein
VLSALVTAATPYRDPLDETTTAALGLAYAQREHRGTNRMNMQASDEQAAMSAQQLLAAARVLGEALEEAGVDLNTLPGGGDEEIVEVEMEQAYTEVMGMIPGDPEPNAPYAHLEIDDDMPEETDTGMQFEQPEEVTTAEARRMLDEQLHQWVSLNRLSFQPADLAPVTVKANRKRPWLQGELKRLVKEGVLRNDAHGEYDIVKDPLMSALQ